MYTGLSKSLIINGLDNVVSTGDNAYSVTKYEYDHMNRISKHIDPLNQVETYTYNSNNQLIGKVDRNGNIHTYTYKGADILKEQIKNVQNTQEVSKTYNWAVGHNLQSITDESGSQINFTHDPFGRLLKETEDNIVKEYTYDENGNLITELIKDASNTIRSTTYTYDKLNRLTKVTENGTEEATYSYDINGNRKTLTYKNGNSAEYAYNLANSITELNNKQNNTEILKFQYDYSLDGNQLSEKQPLIEKESRYTYDDLGRLQTESEIISSTINQSYQYTYDDYNNRKSLVASGQDSYSKEYEYDLNNRLNKDIKNIAGILANTNTYGYDANGNTITNTIKVPNESDIIQTRTYNLYNQVKATNTSQDMINYTYSINGMRNSKTINGIRTEFINSGGHVVAENTTGQYTTYLRGINLIANSTNQDYYLYNAHGDVVALADEAGNVKKQYQYDAFGVELTPDQTDINLFRYCGEYYDQETGEIYLRARYYNPVIGRFITEDSYRGQANDPLSLNLYTYCQNNPVYYIDPTGHSGIAADSDIWMWLGEIIGQGAVQLGKGASAVSKVSPAVIAGWLFLDKFSIQAGETDEQIALIEQQYAEDDSFDIMDQYELEIQYRKDNRANASQNLRDNMNSNGMKPPNGPNAAHHIVAYAAKKAAEAREKLTEFGVHVNDAVNGVFMKIAEHRRVHTNAYFEKVNKLLENVTTQEELVETLNDIAEQINNGTFLN